jgi:hypothetical protein
LLAAAEIEVRAANFQSKADIFQLCGFFDERMGNYPRGTAPDFPLDDMLYVFTVIKDMVITMLWKGTEIATATSRFFRFVCTKYSH